MIFCKYSGVKSLRAVKKILSVKWKKNLSLSLIFGDCNFFVLC